jgi:hypothetical protein
LTYYVVDNVKDKMNNYLLTSIATLPTGYIEYLNVLKSEGIINILLNKNYYGL